MAAGAAGALSVFALAALAVKVKPRRSEHLPNPPSCLVRATATRLRVWVTSSHPWLTPRGPARTPEPMPTAAFCLEGHGADCSVCALRRCGSAWWPPPQGTLRWHLHHLKMSRSTTASCPAKGPRSRGGSMLSRSIRDPEETTAAHACTIASGFNLILMVGISPHCSQ